MKCGQCGSTDITLRAGQERDGYEGVAVCHGCGRVGVASEDSWGEVLEALESMMAEEKRQ